MEMGRIAIALIMLAGVCPASTGMDVSFDDANVLQGIRVGKATFVTGGGELWTAEFSAGPNREERISVSRPPSSGMSALESVPVRSFWKRRGCITFREYRRRSRNGFTSTPRPIG